VLEDLALTLILEAGQHTPVAEAAWLHALRTMDEDPEAHALTGLALAFWGQPLEWRRRLRHCDHTGLCRAVLPGSYGQPTRALLHEGPCANGSAPASGR
jgi:hypothetical protein